MASFDQLISHRFRGFAACDNRLAGLLEALDNSVQQVEFDIRVAKCGTPLITHDEAASDRAGTLRHIRNVRDADRMGLGGEFAAMVTADALLAAIAAHPNRTCRLLIDIKDAGFEEAIYALCAKYGLRDRTLWVSWLPEVLYALHELDEAASLCLSHWCQSPNEMIRAVHHVFEATHGHIERPDRTLVHGERSGWFVDGPLRGTLRRMVDWVCVPAGQITAELVRDYHSDGTQISAFSYLTREKIEVAERAFGHDAFFCDAREPFDAYSASLAGSGR
ncbi:MAG: hypothetical protein WBF53_12105 [Litorimonas sp.]